MQTAVIGFRPLAGIDCKIQTVYTVTCHLSFRPLAGRTLSVTAYAVPAPPTGELNIGVNGSCKSSPFGRAGAQRLRGFCGDKLK